MGSRYIERFSVQTREYFVALKQVREHSAFPCVITDDTVRFISGVLSRDGSDCEGIKMMFIRYSYFILKLEEFEAACFAVKVIYILNVKLYITLKAKHVLSVPSISAKTCAVN